MNIKMHPVAAEMPPLTLPQMSAVPAWRRWVNGNLIRLCLWFGLQAALGYFCRFAVVPTAHAVLTFGVGMWAALISRKREHGLYAMAYIVGSEVLWRMGRAQIFWETGKYFVLAIALAMMIRHGLFRYAGLPVAYFAVLLPSVVLPLANLETLALQQTISFYLSGPLTLAVCYWLGSNLKFSRAQVLQACLFILGPVISIATMALLSILQAQDLYFGKSSNAQASGGFGPNQVSATLGLGFLAAFLYTILEKRERWLRVLLALVLVWLAAQCVLTFSRTGLYLAGLSSFIGALNLLRDQRARLKLIAAALLIGGGLFFVLPILENFTQGALSQRFTNFDATGRDSLAAQELAIWGDHPIFGVGPGQAGQYRTGELRGLMAHTEYSRLLAEHGLFGLCAIALILALGLKNIRAAQSVTQRAFTLAFLSWGLLFMFTSAMRTVAPAFLFGLTSLRWRDEDE